MTTANPSDNSTDWWRRECGMRDVLLLGLPLVISTSSFAFMYFCDRLFLTWYSTLDMAAVMQASSLSWSAVSFPMGMATYAMAFVAQYHGANRPERVGAVTWQAARIAPYATPFFFAVAVLSPLVFYAFGHDVELVRRESLYFQILAVGLPGIVLATACNAFFVGIERPRLVMVIDVFSAIVNVLLDYVLIFGVAGFPELGLVGAGLATVIAIWLKVALFVMAIFCYGDVNRYQFRAGRALDWRLLGRLFRFGGPNGLQFFLEGSAFTLILMFMGKLGTLALAATTLAISVNLVAFIPMVGIAMAVTTMVGNQIGRGRPDLARRATWNGVGLAMIYSLGFAVAYWTMPQWFLVLHDLEASGDQELQAWAVFLLKFVAVYCVFDALQLIFASAIKGAGDTAFTVYVLTVSTVVLLGVGLLGENRFSTTEAKIVWWWALLTGFLVSLAIVFYLRFMQGKWETMTVMDQDDDLIDLPLGPVTDLEVERVVDPQIFEHVEQRSVDPA